MNDLSCPVVRDLLPLYAEGLASEETASLVEAHLGACPDCRAALEAVRAPAELPAEKRDGAVLVTKEELSQFAVPSAFRTWTEYYALKE